MCASVEVTRRHFFVNCLRSLPAFVGCFLELNDVYWVLSSTNVFFKVSTHFYDESEFIVASLSPISFCKTVHQSYIKDKKAA